MKTSLIPLAAVILALVATSAGVLALTGGDTPIRSDEGIDPYECDLVHNIDACDQDDLDRLGGGGLPPVNPDAGNDGSCEPMPLRSDCGIDPNVSDFPAEVVNSWGVTTFRKAGDEPPDGVAGMTTVASMIRLPLDRQVAEGQAIVVGTVIDISPGYSNSVGGGFWYNPSSLAPGWILQDVTIEVERVLGDTAGLTAVGDARKESIVVTIWGGQIEVTFDESVDPALLPEGFEPGHTYMVASASNVRVAEGDRVLVFLYMQMSPWFGAPVDPEMPWGKTPATPCPTQPLGTKIVVFGSWHQLGAEDQHITVTELTVNSDEFAALAPEAQDAAFAERAVTFDELEALAEAELGQSLEDPSAPLGHGNGWPSIDDHPPPPCYTRHPPAPPPDHTHPEYEN